MQHEEQLIHNLQSGQTECFSELYNTHFQTIYNHIYYKTLNQSLTEDVVSDTFFKAFDKIHQFVYKSETSFCSWLYTIANNTLLDSYKKINPDSLDESNNYESNESVTTVQNNRYISEQILHELDKLGEKKKDIVIMRLWEGLSYEEIAEITGRSEVSLRKDFSIAMKELKVVASKLGALMVIIILISIYGI